MPSNWCPTSFGNLHLQDEFLNMNTVERLQFERSRKIDAELRKEAEDNLKVLKILLLGASDSGKSTISKQMRILHTEGFTDSEKFHYKHTLYNNYLDCFYYIAKGIKKRCMEVPTTEAELVNIFAQSYCGEFFHLNRSQELCEVIKTFLNYSSVKLACQKINEFYVPDNTEYLLENVPRILQADYTPSTEDIIHSRATTKGIYETIYSFRDFKIRLIDVGGQKTERRKWIHCFEGVAAILFILSLSCYNQVMHEDSQVSQMADTIELFKSIYRNRFLRASSFIMFLNKKDLFAKKILQVPLYKFYPSFAAKIRPNMTGDELYNAGVEYVKQMFMMVRGHGKRHIYVHVTNATDTQNIDFVFNAICDIIISKNIKTAGIS